MQIKTRKQILMGFINDRLCNELIFPGGCNSKQKCPFQEG